MIVHVVTEEQVREFQLIRRALRKYLSGEGLPDKQAQKLKRMLTKKHGRMRRRK